MTTLRDAALALIEAEERTRKARNGQGHPGEPHDEILRHPGDAASSSPFGDCANCGGAQYGSEDDENRARGDLRAALGLERRPWE